MKETVNPKTYNVMVTMRCTYYLDDVLRSLQNACINLHKDAATLSLLNEDHAQECLHLTRNFHENLASMELHLTLLKNFYQCDYEDIKEKYINQLAKKYHIK